MKRPHGMNIVPNVINPNTIACSIRPVRVGHPRLAMELPNSDEVILYMNGDATIKKMTAENIEILAFIDVDGESLAII